MNYEAAVVQKECNRIAGLIIECILTGGNKLFIDIDPLVEEEIIEYIKDYFNYEIKDIGMGYVISWEDED